MPIALSSLAAAALTIGVVPASCAILRSQGEIRTRVRAGIETWCFFIVGFSTVTPTRLMTWSTIGMGYGVAGASIFQLAQTW
jgi:hypothetical protein